MGRFNAASTIRRLRRLQYPASFDYTAALERFSIRIGSAMIQTAPLAITMCDASGIGPEIVAKILAKDHERAIVFGSFVVM